ncbi:hypothetical protein, partial [Liquorilactobacillus ghanensis]|uniref:hypothetical protein n=1 Tax=Liquorilactobacillus ghanensis TaxID=399370 RepID=UPI0039E80B04
NSLIFTDRKKLIKLLDETNIDHPYFKLQKAKVITDQELQKQAVTNLMNEIDTFASPYEDLFILAISHHINPQKLISALNNHGLMNLVNNTNRYFIEKIKLIPDFITKIEKSWPSCPQRSLLLMAMRENYLFSNQIVLSDIYREIGNYIKDSLDFAHTLYQKECFQPEPSNLLPEKYKFVFYLDHAFKAKNKKDTAKFFKNLRIALECAPQANSLIKRLISNFTVKQQKNTQEQQEFQQLAANIKIKIRALIAGKQQQAALPLLKTLADIIPNDPEVTKLLQQIDK